MSTLLKKKYLQGRLENKATATAASVKRDDAATTSLESPRKRKLEATVSTPVRLRKVSFMELVTIIVPPLHQRNAQGEPYHPPLDAETLQLYRQDIWYTRHEYRTFWKDRMDSVRLYRSVNGDLASWGPELSEQYTIRGLESYVMGDTDEQAPDNASRQQQRDATTGAVLEHQDCERIRPLIAPWSALALERAQRYAALDAHDAYAIDQTAAAPVVPHGDISTSAIGHHECLSPPCSPNSVILDVDEVTKLDAPALARTSPNHDLIKTMNQRLIQQMQQEQQESVSKKPRRRTTLPHLPMDATFTASTHGMLTPMEQRRLLIIEQRRNSMQLARLQQEQLQLEQQKQEEKRRRHRRRSMSNHQPLHLGSDYDRHMNFCHQLLQSHQQLASRHDHRDTHRAYRSSSDDRRPCGARHRDSLALGLSHYYQRDNEPVAAHPTMGRDTLDALQDEYLQSLGNTVGAAPMRAAAGRRDSLQVAYSAANQHHNGHTYESNLSTNQRCSPPPAQAYPLQPEAMYTDSVTKLSHLRRDSLFGGHY